MTFRMEENETEIDCVHEKRAPTVYAKFEGNPCVVSTCISDSRYRCEENKECNEKDMC